MGKIIYDGNEIPVFHSLIQHEEILYAIAKEDKHCYLYAGRNHSWECVAKLCNRGNRDFRLRKTDGKLGVCSVDENGEYGRFVEIPSSVIKRATELN